MLKKTSHPQKRIGIGDNGFWGKTPPGNSRSYAISIDLNQKKLAEYYAGTNPNDGYDTIRQILENHGFKRHQGNLWVGDANQTSVTCVVAVQAIQRACPWFKDAINDLKMLRIEENNDLWPALMQPPS